MAVHPPARNTQATSSATSRPLSPSSFPTTTTPSSHATLNQRIDHLLLTIASNTHRLALEAAYDPSIPFHPGCKDCVRDYVRHVRGAQPLKAAVEAAKEGERVKREWERLQEEGGVLREMREGRREEVGRWEGLVRGGMDVAGYKRERKTGAGGEKKGGDEAIKSSQSQSQASASPTSLAKAAKAMWGGRAARQGGEGARAAAAAAASPRSRNAEPAAQARTSSGFGPDFLSANIKTHGKDSRHDIEQAQQAFHNLDLDQQLALLLNAGQSP